VLTYHALGYYGLFGVPVALVLARLLPPGSRARRLAAGAALAALSLIAAIVLLSY